jgi:hypothetical protein
MRIMVFLTTLLAALPLSVHAQSVQQTFLKFGLIGVWARACDQPANMDAANSHAIYALSGHDGVMLTYENGPKYGPTIYTVLSAEQEGADQLTYLQQRFNSQQRATVTVRKFGDQIGVQSSVLEGGKVLVRDGKFTASGLEGPRQSRCRG